MKVREYFHEADQTHIALGIPTEEAERMEEQVNELLLKKKEEKGSISLSETYNFLVKIAEDDLSRFYLAICLFVWKTHGFAYTILQETKGGNQKEHILSFREFLASKFGVTLNRQKMTSYSYVLEGIDPDSITYHPDEPYSNADVTFTNTINDLKANATEDKGEFVELYLYLNGACESIKEVRKVADSGMSKLEKMLQALKGAIGVFLVFLTALTLFSCTSIKELPAGGTRCVSAPYCFAYSMMLEENEKGNREFTISISDADPGIGIIRGRFYYTAPFYSNGTPWNKVILFDYFPEMGRYVAFPMDGANVQMFDDYTRKVGTHFEKRDRSYPYCD